MIETLGGLWQLVCLVLREGPRLRGRYWRWRFETAFGTDPARMPARSARLRRILEYGRWLHRMQRGG
jgi:hypothetical protein